MEPPGELGSEGASLASVWRFAARTQEALDSVLQREVGICLGQWRVLQEVIADRGHVNATIVGRRLGCSHANVGRIVRRLLRDARVTRTPPNFARVGHALRETEAGYEVWKAGERFVRQLSQRWLAEIHADDGEPLQALVAATIAAARAKP